MNAGIAPEQILKQLSELWVSLGKQGPAETGGGVLRACSMTLVVLAEMDDDPGTLGETVAALMPEHPARAILVRLRGAATNGLAARVYSQCWMPFGQRRQICCEQIEISAPDTTLADLPPLLEPLAAADLPLIVWCRSARLARLREFWEIARTARKVILESPQLAKSPGSTQSALDLLQQAVRNGVIVGDLAWTRLTRLREAVAQIFENRKYLELLPKLNAVRITFAAGQETSARYLAAWMANALDKAGAHAKFDLAPGETFSVDLSGETLRVRESCSDGTLTIAINGLSQCTNMPRPTDYLLMREELGIQRRDPVFEATLASAAKLAYPDGK